MPLLNENVSMTISCMIVLFSLRQYLQFDILAWVVGIPLLLGAIVLLIFQYRQSKSLRKELQQLSKVKVHSVEYDLVLKAMRLAIWHYDVATRTVTYETDYRDSSNTVVFAPGTSVDEICNWMMPEYVGKLKEGMRTLKEGKIDVYYMQYRMKVPHSDHHYWYESYATVDKRDLQGRALSVVGTSMHIDQQKEIEDALMDAVYHAEESDRLKSAFLANISHEIRTPLNAIVGFSEVLTAVDDGEERQHLVELIKKNNTHLLRLFGDIVNMSKLEARGGGALKMSSFELKDIFNELKEKYKPQSEEKGLPIVIENEASLPLLTSDRDRVREIMNQYLNNAMKFTDAGQVTLGCTEHEGKWRLWVRDTGKGIPADKCNEHLFERFVKVDEFVAGIGLGLSICRSLAMTMNGEVGVESVINKGSTFWVELNK